MRLHARVFFIRKGIIYLVSCNYFLFSKLKIPIKGTRYKAFLRLNRRNHSIECGAKTLKKSFEMHVTRCKRCIATDGTYFE